MKIYIVTEEEWENSIIRGVFYDKEVAKNAVRNTYQGMRIIEEEDGFQIFELDSILQQENIYPTLISITEYEISSVPTIIKAF